MRGARKLIGVGAGLGLIAALTVVAVPPVGAANPNPFGSITHSITLPDPVAAGTVHLYFVHGIPSAGPLDLCADGPTTIAANVSYGSVVLATPAAGVAGLTIRTATAAPCTGPVVASSPGGSVGLPDGLNASAIANVAGGAPNLDVIDNDSGPAAAGDGRLEVFPRANAPTLVVKVDGQAPPVPEQGNPLLPGGPNYSVDLPAGSHDVAVTLLDGTVLKDFPGTTISDGVLFQIFLVGDALFTEPTVPTAPPATPVTGTPRFTG